MKVFCAPDPIRSSTNKLARPDLGHAQACTVSSREFISPSLESLCGCRWPHLASLLRPPSIKVGQRARTRHAQQWRARLPRFLVARGGPTTVRIHFNTNCRIGPTPGQSNMKSSISGQLFDILDTTLVNASSKMITQIRFFDDSQLK